MVPLIFFKNTSWYEKLFSFFLVIFSLEGREESSDSGREREREIFVSNDPNHKKY